MWFTNPDIISCVLDFAYEEYDSILLSSLYGDYSSGVVYDKKKIDTDVLNFQLVSKTFRNTFLNFVEKYLVERYKYNATTCPRPVLALFHSYNFASVKRITIDKRTFDFLEIKKSEKFNKNIFSSFLPFMTEKFRTFFLEKNITFETITKPFSTREQRNVNIGKRKIDDISLSCVYNIQNMKTGEIEKKDFIDTISIFRAYPTSHTLEFCVKCPVITESDNVYTVSCISQRPCETLSGNTMVSLSEKKCENNHVIYRQKKYPVINVFSSFVLEHI